MFRAAGTRNRRPRNAHHRLTQPTFNYVWLTRARLHIPRAVFPQELRPQNAMVAVDAILDLVDMLA